MRANWSRRPLARRHPPLTVPHPDPDAAPEPPDHAEEDGAERRRWRLARNAKSRLDKYLQNRVKGISRHQIQKLIALGGVMINGKIPKPSAALHKGDVVEVILPPRPATQLKPQWIPLDILYEDDHFIVLNKQRGLIVHPARSHLTGTLLNGLLYHFAGEGGRAKSEERGARSEGEGQRASTPTCRPSLPGPRPGVVHRLDMNTTGVIIVAKRDEAHWLLARQFEHRTNLKVYLAVVHGVPDQPAGAIDQPIGKHPTIREAMAVRHDSAGRDALTLYRLRERYAGYSLLELELKTGRTHQVRVHLSYLGYPLVGDILYGGDPVGAAELASPPSAPGSGPYLNFARDKLEGKKIERAVAQRRDIILATPALHAALLRLMHPVRQHEMTFTAPVHEPMRELIHQLRQRPWPGPVVSQGFWLDLKKIVPA